MLMAQAEAPPMSSRAVAKEMGAAKDDHGVLPMKGKRRRPTQYGTGLSRC